MTHLAILLILNAAPPAEYTAEQRMKLPRFSANYDESVRAWKAGKHAEAIAARRRALALSVEIFGDHPTTASWFSGVADLEERAGNPTAAAKLLREEARLWERLGGKGHHKAVDALWKARDNEPPLLAKKARIAEAIRPIPRALRLSKEGKHREAIPVVRKTIAALRELTGEEHPLYSDNLYSLALMLKEDGGRLEALPLFRRALDICEKTQGHRHPSTTQTRNSLAVLLNTLGDHGEALPLFKKALVELREQSGTGDPQYAHALFNLACVYRDLGDHARGLAFQRRSLAIYEAASDTGSTYTSGLGNMALFLQAMGDQAAAVGYRKRVLSLVKRSVGERHPRYAEALGKLALDTGLAGDIEASLEMHRRSLKLKKELFGEKHPSYSVGLNYLASVLKNGGRKEEALDVFRHVLRLDKDAYGEKSGNYATGLNNVALLLMEMGKVEEALPLFEKALPITRAAHGDSHPDHAMALNHLALAHVEAGNEKAALPLAERAAALTVARLRDYAGVQSDRQQIEAASRFRQFLDTRLSIRLEDAACAGHLLTWKGGVFMRQRQRRLFLRLAGDPETREATARLKSATATLAGLKLAPSAKPNELAAMEKELEEAQAELSRLASTFREAAETERATPDALARALPEGAVLIDFVIHGDRMTKGPKRSLAAFVHRRGKAATRVDCGAAIEVEKAVEAWRAALLKRHAGEKEGRGLHGLIWQPLQKHLEGAKVILLSPDGVLGTVPFAALPGKEKGSYLIEDVAVAVVPVPRAIPELLKPVDRKARLSPSLLVAGDLRYEPEEGSVAPLAEEDSRAAPRSGRLGFSRLPATREEAASVRDSFSRLFRAGTVADLREGEATKRAVREALGKSRYAHFATHGYFMPEGKSGAWHPLLLSGLALSDANRVPKPGEEDGILTALEVSEMDLSRLELAVLSACETGLGKVAGGEGILGMQRAFAAAGARSVVASLWKVDDNATQQLMTAFYAAAWDTKKIIGRAEALRQAQLAMLRDGVRRGMVREDDMGARRTPPYYWAAFVLSGDWR